MSYDDKKHLKLQVETSGGTDAVEDHVVFDFSGTQDPDITDIALILTARLQSAPTDSVWARAVSWRTAQILRFLRMEHLFRQYPTDGGQLN